MLLNCLALWRLTIYGIVGLFLTFNVNRMLWNSLLLFIHCMCLRPYRICILIIACSSDIEETFFCSFTLYMLHTLPSLCSCYIVCGWHLEESLSCYLLISPAYTLQYQPLLLLLCLWLLICRNFSLFILYGNRYPASFKSHVVHNLRESFPI